MLYKLYADKRFIKYFSYFWRMDVKEAIETRRSIRKFSPKELHPEEIIDLVDAGRYAPSAGNQQNWKFILIKDQNRKNEIADACFQQTWMASAPLMICVVGMTEDVKRMYGTRGEMLYSIQNCAIASQNIMLRAHEMGFGSCMISAFEEGMIKRILNIGDEGRPQCFICVGYSTDTPDKKLLKNLHVLTYFETMFDRTEDYDDAFYMWSGIGKKTGEKLLAKMKEGVGTLRDRINKKFEKDEKAEKVKEILETEHKDKIETKDQ